MTTASRHPEHRVAVLDDYQAVALTVTDWSAVGPVGTVTSYQDHLSDADEIVSRLDGYDVIVAMRERTGVSSVPPQATARPEAACSAE